MKNFFKNPANLLILSIMVLTMIGVQSLISCSDKDNSGGTSSNKSVCISNALEIKANTLQDIADECGVSRVDVLAQIDGSYIGSCKKNELDFDIKIKDIEIICEVADIPVVPPGNTSSSSGNSGNTIIGSNIITETYNITEKTDNFFRIEGYPKISYICKIGGILEAREYKDYTHEIIYSISNGVLTLHDDCYDKNNTNFQYSGTSNSLAGTWTRNLYKDASCKFDYTSDCNYEKCDNISKIEFAENSVKFTHEVCPVNFFPRGDGDEFIYRSTGNIFNKGWKFRPIDCNNGELFKGNEIVKLNGYTDKHGKILSVKATYNNKSCTLSHKEFSLSEKKAACEAAYDKYLVDGGDIEDYYYATIGTTNEGKKDMAEFFKCVRENGPKDFEDYCNGCSYKYE